MALNPEQALALSSFTDFNPLVQEYLDEFCYLVLFDPTNAAVSDFTPSNPQRSFILDIWNETRPDVIRKLAKIIKYIAVGSQNTASEVIILLRTGSPATTTTVYDVFKTQIPLLRAEEPNNP